LSGASFQNKACYQGKIHSNEYCEIDDQGSQIIFKTTHPLSLGEGLTVSASLPKGVVAKKEIWEKEPFDFNSLFLKFKNWIIGIFLSFIGGLVWFVRKYKNKYNPHREIIPEYLPYNNFHPALTGYLIDQSFDNRDLTAGILSLAQKGYIEIERVEEKGVLFGKKIDYIFRRKVEVENVVDELDKMFLNFLFQHNRLSFSEIVSVFNSIQQGETVELLEEVKLSEFSSFAHELISQKNDLRD
jgi:hypothetical protein